MKAEIARQAAFETNKFLKNQIGSLRKKELDAAATFRNRPLNLWGWYSPNALCTALIHPHTVANTLAVLSQAERAVLDLLLISRGQASLTEIGAEFRWSSEETSKTVVPLRDCLLIELSRDEIVTLYSEYVSLIEISPAQARRLRFLLAGLSRKRLEDLVKASSLPPRGRVESVAALAAMYSRADVLQAAFQLLPADLQAAIQEIAGMGSRSLANPHPGAHNEFTHRLNACLPFVFLFEPKTKDAAHLAVVPKEVGTALLCGFQKVPDDNGPALAAFLKPQKRSIHRSDQYQGRAAPDLIRLGLMLARGEARLTQQRSVSVPDIKKLQKRFPGAGHGYAEFLLSLARTHRWYEFSDFVSKASPKFFSDSSSYDWTDLCLQAWLKTQTWREEERDGDEDATKSVRQMVLGVLAECPADEWLMADRLSVVLLERHPELQSGSENEAIHRILLETLPWIGILEAGEDTEGQGYVKVSEGAIATIKRTLSGKPPGAQRNDAARSGASLTIQPTGEIVVLDGLNMSLLLKLSAFADPETIDRASVFNLTRQSLANALDQGIDSATVAAFLEKESSRPLPGPVAQMLTSMNTEKWQVSLGGYLISAPSLEALDALLSKPPAGWNLSRIAPSVAAIDLNGDARDILEGLKKTGRRAIADRSLAGEHPPRLQWKQVRISTHLQELFNDPPNQTRTSKKAATRDAILKTLDSAVEWQSSVSIGYTINNKHDVAHVVLSLCDYNSSSLCGYDDRNNHLKISFGRIVDIEVSAQQDDSSRQLRH